MWSMLTTLEGNTYVMWNAMYTTRITVFRPGGRLVLATHYGFIVSRNDMTDWEGCSFGHPANLATHEVI